MEAKYIIAVTVPSVLLFVVLSVVIGILVARRAGRRRSSTGMEAPSDGSSRVTLTKEAFTSRTYENYGISIPPSMYSPSIKSPHYNTFSSRHDRKSSLGGTSIMLPPTALNMHNKNIASRSTLDLEGLMHLPNTPTRMSR